MKKFLIMSLVVLCVASNAFATETDSESEYIAKINHKMHRGFRNLVSSEMVIPHYVDVETEKHGDKKGKVYGTIRGVNMIAVRKLVGLLDMLTAPFPFDIYVFNPEIPGGEVK